MGGARPWGCLGLAGSLSGRHPPSLPPRPKCHSHLLPCRWEPPGPRAGCWGEGTWSSAGKAASFQGRRSRVVTSGPVRWVQTGQDHVQGSRMPAARMAKGGRGAGVCPSTLFCRVRCRVHLWGYLRLWTCMAF